MQRAPFVFGRIAERADFVDRTPEREHLASNFRSGVNTVIISPRRWGKSSLVHQTAADLATDKSVRLCLIDLFNVRSEADFYAHLAKGVMTATLPKWEEWVEAAGRFMSHLRPKVSIATDLNQSISLDMDWHQAEQDPDEVLDLAEKIAESKKLRLVICVDEFQAIADFPDSVVFQQKLRSHWQLHQHVCYCLYGSKRHMLLDIFANPDGPFYRFGDILLLDKISNDIWGDFVAQRFADTGKHATPEQGRLIAALVDNHPYYVQQLAQQVWFRTPAECTDDLITTALTDLTSQLSLLFTGLATSLTARQLNFLRAVINHEPALFAQATLKAYDLGTSANVARIKETLVNREIIDVTSGDIEVLDPLFKHWLVTEYFRQDGPA